MDCDPFISCDPFICVIWLICACDWMIYVRDMIWLMVVLVCVCYCWFKVGWCQWYMSRQYVRSASKYVHVKSCQCVMCHTSSSHIDESWRTYQRYMKRICMFLLLPFCYQVLSMRHVARTQDACHTYQKYIKSHVTHIHESRCTCALVRPHISTIHGTHISCTFVSNVAQMYATHTFKNVQVSHISCAQSM